MTEQPQHPGPSEERVEQVMGNLLRIGVIVSAIVVFLGGLLYLLHDGRLPAPNLSEFHGQPEELRSLAGIVRQAAALNSLGLIMLGLLLLIATPVARVTFSIFAFLLQRDSLYVLFTILVLAVLLYSLFSGYLSGSGAL